MGIRVFRKQFSKGGGNPQPAGNGEKDKFKSFKDVIKSALEITNIRDRQSQIDIILKQDLPKMKSTDIAFLVSSCGKLRVCVVAYASAIAGALSRIPEPMLHIYAPLVSSGAFRDGCVRPACVAGVFETVLCSRRSLASPTFYFLHVSETVLELHGAVRSSVIGVVS
jgi:hypothetical protein